MLLFVNGQAKEYALWFCSVRKRSRVASKTKWKIESDAHQQRHEGGENHIFLLQPKKKRAPSNQCHGLRAHNQIHGFTRHVLVQNLLNDGCHLIAFFPGVHVAKMSRRK